ncbi:MAG: abortive infection family protein, partial [Candidatus Microthrix parvicella]
DDPSLLLGTAKEMLESTGKYVTEQFSVPLRPNTTFDELWHHARERLDLLPQQVNVSAAGGKQVREILQSSWSIAQMTNQIRNDEGTGHGRTLPTAVTPEIAMMVVREACSVAEMVLSKLDRAIGRQR